MRSKSVFYAALLMFFLCTAQVSGQNYKTGIGVRLGYFNGLTLKHFVNDKNALEGLLSFRWDGIIVTGLYEWQKPIPGADGLDWLVGVGGHLGFWNDGYWDRYDHGSHSVLGVDFILGLEYSFREVPFSIELDWKPAFNLIGDNHWWGDGLGLSLRYNFK